MITTKGPQGKKKVAVLRPFFYEGKVVKAGEKLEVPAAFAFEMKAANKVEILSSVKEAVDLVEEPAEKVKKGKKEE